MLATQTQYSQRNKIFLKTNKNTNLHLHSHRHLLLVSHLIKVITVWGFPGGSDGKESAYNLGDLGLIPGSGRSPRDRHGNPLQYSCLEKPHRQRSPAGYSPWGGKESDKTATSTFTTWRHLEDITLGGRNQSPRDK